MNELVAYKSLVVSLFLLGFFLAERLAPAVPVPTPLKKAPRLLKNLGLWGCNLVVSLLIVLPVTLLAATHSQPWWSPPLPAWFRLLIALLLLDLWIYWWHRASHRIGFLWRFHRVHHLDQWLDVTSAVRFHFGEVILSALIRAVVIFCFALPLASVIVFETLVLIVTAFHHSNMRLPKSLERVLSYLVITPSIHWVHHHVTQPDTDSNYGTLFSFWDRLFGSRSNTRRTPEMAIGLDNFHDRGFWQLLAAPFQAVPVRQCIQATPQSGEQRGDGSNKTP